MIMGVAFATLATWMVASHVRLTRRPVAKAVAEVVRYLNSPRHDSQLREVELPHAVPLSDHMVKEVAAQYGYQFVSIRSRQGNTTLQFTKPGGKRRKLSIDD